MLVGAVRKTLQIPDGISANFTVFRALPTKNLYIYLQSKFGYCELLHASLLVAAQCLRHNASPLLRNLLRLLGRARRRCSRRHWCRRCGCRCCWRRSRCSYRTSRQTIHHTATGSRRTVPQESQRQRSGKKHRCGDTGRFRQEVGRSGSAEQSAGGTRTESSAHICALPMLHQHQTDNRQCG